MVHWTRSHLLQTLSCCYLIIVILDWLLEKAMRWLHFKYSRVLLGFITDLLRLILYLHYLGWLHYSAGNGSADECAFAIFKTFRWGSLFCPWLCWTWRTSAMIFLFSHWVLEVLSCLVVIPPLYLLFPHFITSILFLHFFTGFFEVFVYWHRTCLYRRGDEARWHKWLALPVS